MIGTTIVLSNTGCPYPGGAAVTFTQGEVTALGKLVCWGSAGVSFLVRLTDGREVFVRADKQPKENERFLRRIARKARALSASRSEGWRTTWMTA